MRTNTFRVETTFPTEANALLHHSSSEVCAISLAASSTQPDRDRPNDSTVIESEQTFWSFLCADRTFQLYALSGLITHAGEWLAYIACVRFIEDNTGNDDDVSASSSPALAISMLVVLRLIPKLIFSALGGVLSDSTDRKKTMVYLAIASGSVSLLYLLAIRFQSLALMYTLAFSQEIIVSLYQPADQAMYPQLMPNDKLMEQGAVWSETAYAAIASFAASLGGFFVVWFGLDMCFVIDSLMGFSSAALLLLIPGKWTADSDGERNEEGEFSQNVATICDSGDNENDTSLHTIDNYHSMAWNGFEYIWNSSFASYVLIKATGMSLYGAVEVIAVAFAGQGSPNPDDASRKLGIIYSFYGLGCLCGPFVSNTCTDIKRPRTLVFASVASFCLISLSWGGLSLVESFSARCVFMMLSSLGAEVLWLDSDLLLLSHSKNEFLGRVTALDSSLSVSMEAFSALLAGILQDQVNLSPKNVCFTFAVFGLVSVVVWILFLVRKYGFP